MSTTKMRQEIRRLQKEIFLLEIKLFRPLPMVEYSLVEVYLPCGKKKCRCKQGFLHGPYYYLSQHHKGKTKNIYIPKEAVLRIRPLAQRYKDYEISLTTIRRLNQKVLELLKEIEKSVFVAPSKLNLKKAKGKKQ